MEGRLEKGREGKESEKERGRAPGSMQSTENTGRGIGKGWMRAKNERNGGGGGGVRDS